MSKCCTDILMTAKHPVVFLAFKLLLQTVCLVTRMQDFLQQKDVCVICVRNVLVV